MKDLSNFENHNCLDKRTGECLGIVLATDLFTDLGDSSCYKSYLWTIEDGTIALNTFVGDEIENVEVSAEPITMQEIVHNAALLISRWQELEDIDHDEAVVAYNQRNDFVRKIADLMNANGLATEFNVELLKVCLASFSLN